MKYLVIVSFPILLLIFSPGYTQETKDEKAVILKIINLRSEIGQIGLSIYNTEEGFPKEESRIYRKMVVKNWKGDTALVVIEDLPVGEYAICLWHDENFDMDMNYTFIGIPKEGYCFSNNVQPTLRAPKWKEAKFTFSGETIIQKIEMKYW